MYKQIQISILLFYIFTTSLIQGQTVFDQEQSIILNSSVYEVVIKKESYDPLTYAQELPLDMIPYHIRTDDYTPIGTAFAVDSNILLTAAHVLALDKKSLKNKIFLRDNQMKLYSIDKILKYDNHRDFALFSVADLELENWLSLDKNIVLNTPVKAVGNAHGQGIIIREGLLTSQTPESVNGDWKWLRYSAAASPGNSGGPLINNKGNVIGIVTAKSENENLNYALPIKEVGNIETGNVFFRMDYNYAIPVSKSRDREITEFNFSLPLSVNQLRDILINEREKSYSKSFNELIANNHNEIFPYDMDGQKSLLQTIYTGSFPVFVREKDDSTWSLIQPKEINSSAISSGGEISYGDLWGDTLFLLENMEMQKIIDMFNNPRELMETILDGYLLNRNISSESIKITSMGEPEKAGKVIDSWGRAWLTASFSIPFADKSFLLYALPTPEGVIGFFSIVDYYNTFPFHQDFIQMMNHVTFSYEATIENWKHFMQNNGFLPEFIRNMSFDYIIGEEFNLDTDRISLQFDHNLIGISPQSILSIIPSFIKDLDKTTWNISRIYYFENENKRSYISLERTFPPLDKNDTKTLETWNNLQEGKYPYTGNTILSKERTYMFENMIPKGAGTQSNELNFSWSIGLCIDSELESNDMNARFRYLMNGFVLKNSEGESASYGYNEYRENSMTIIDGSNIFQAISNEKDEIIHKFLSEEIDLNKINYEGRSPIMVAARLGKEDIVQKLLDKNVNLETQDNYGHTVLIISLRNLPENISLNIIKKGIHLNTTDDEGYSPLMIACKNEYVESAKLLINMGVNISNNNSTGKSALYYSSYYGLNDISKLLIKKGAPTNSAHTNGYSTLMAAFAHSSEEVVQLLIDYNAPLDEVTSSGWSTLHSAIRYGSESLSWKFIRISSYLDRKNSELWTPLHLALRYNKPAIAQYLIEKENGIDTQNDNKWTPLHFAIRYNQPEMAKLLIEKDVRLSEPNINLWTPLHLALRYEQPEIAEDLISRGADLNMKDSEEWTPLHVALRFSDPRIAIQIIDRGADIFHRTNENWTPLLLALRYSERDICKLLIDKGSDINTANNNQVTPLMMAAKFNPDLVLALLEKEILLESKDANGKTALHYALEGKNRDAFSLLILKGADIDAENNDGKSPIKLAEELNLLDWFN